MFKMFKKKRSIDQNSGYFKDINVSSSSFGLNSTPRLKLIPDELIGLILEFLTDPYQLWLQLDVPGSLSNVTVGGRVPLNFMLVSKQFHSIAQQALRGALHEFPRQHLIPAASSDVRGGGTGGEFVRNILDNGPRDWNKWFAHTHLPIRVGVNLSAPRTNAAPIAAYAVRFANDMPARDPIAWTVVDASSGDPEALLEGNRPVLHRVCLRNAQTGHPEYIARYEWRVFRLPEPVILERGFSIVITEVRETGHGAQLCQIALLK